MDATDFMSEFEDLGLFASPQPPGGQPPQVLGQPSSKAVKDALGERIRTQIQANSGEKRKLEDLHGSDIILSKTQKMDADHVVLDHSEPPMNGGPRLLAQALMDKR